MTNPITTAAHDLQEASRAMQAHANVLKRDHDRHSDAAELEAVARRWRASAAASINHERTHR